MMLMSIMHYYEHTFFFFTIYNSACIISYEHFIIFMMLYISHHNYL